MADAAKKRKMSKADKEKMKREEQERKAQEEASYEDENENALSSTLSSDMTLVKAARLKTMEENKKQQKEEEAMAVERAKLENEERRCRRIDMTELEAMLEKNRLQLLNDNQTRRKQAKWSRYMRCDGSPDPVNQGEINTYINLRHEDDTRNDAENVLKDSELTLELIDELSFILTDTPIEELSEKVKMLYKETTLELENLISNKLGLALLQLLCDATKLADTETGNLQHIVKNDQISLCVWGNLVKNPRIRNYEFPIIQFSFDIPRVLTLSDCAVSLLITKFDHLSPSSKASIPRRKKKEEVLPPPEPEEQPKEGEGEEKDGEDGEKEEDGEKLEEKEETELDIMAALRGSEELDPEAQPEEEEEEPYEEDFNYPPTPEPTEWEDFEEDDDIVDLRANDVLGGVFELNLMHMPPQPKTMGKWNITQMVDPPRVKHMEYVADPPSTEEKGSKDKDKKDEKTSIHISTLLPKDVMFLGEPIAARWDNKKKMWSTEGVSEPSFNEEARTFSFKTVKFGTMCFLQDSHINMPFQSWDIRPHKVDSAVLTIIAAIVEIEIEIKNSLCCLKQPRDKPELESIRNKWVTPAELIVMMKRAGVNIFPNEDSSKYVNIQAKRMQDKHPTVEESMYQQMALTASAMAYSWSKWNGQTEREQIVFQGSEALEDEPLLEEDWLLFLATKTRVTKLEMTEFDENFSDISHDTELSKSLESAKSLQKAKSPKGPKGKNVKDLKKKQSEEAPLFNPFNAISQSFNVKFKSNIYHLMMMHGSEETKKRIHQTNYQFVDCVHQLLQATRVLTFA